jgi:hypothetical protein
MVPHGKPGSYGLSKLSMATGHGSAAKKFLRENFQQKVSDVLFRFSAVKELNTQVNNLIGYGA